MNRRNTRTILYSTVFWSGGRGSGHGQPVPEIKKEFLGRGIRSNVLVPCLASQSALPTSLAPQSLPKLAKSRNSSLSWSAVDGHQFSRILLELFESSGCSWFPGPSLFRCEEEDRWWACLLARSTIQSSISECFRGSVEAFLLGWVDNLQRWSILRWGEFINLAALVVVQIWWSLVSLERV